MGPKTKKWVVAFIIVWVTMLVHSYILSFITPEMTESAISWIQSGALLSAFFGATIYWKWLKLLKKFKYNERTKKWDQVFEDQR